MAYTKEPKTSAELRAKLAAYQNEYYWANREKIREQRNRYYAERRERARTLEQRLQRASREFIKQLPLEQQEEHKRRLSRVRQKDYRENRSEEKLKQERAKARTAWQKLYHGDEEFRQKKLAYLAEWREKNREKAREYQSKRRAAEKASK